MDRCTVPTRARRKRITGRESPVLMGLAAFCSSYIRLLLALETRKVLVSLKPDVMGHLAGTSTFPETFL